MILILMALLVLGICVIALCARLLDTRKWMRALGVFGGYLALLAVLWLVWVN